jgi:UDP-glucose-4-epimerase GalE
MLETMVDFDVKHLVFSSTAAVYGNPATDRQLTEDDPTAPITPYGETKLAAERLINWVAQAHDLTYTILRYFNAAGADASLKIGQEKQHYTHLIPLATRAALGLGDPVTIYGDDYPTPDGTCVRDYIHVSDLARAHILAATHLLDKGDSLTLNLGTSRGSSVREVLAGVDALHQTPFERGLRRAGDPAVLIADSSRAQAELGWRAERSLEESIRSDFFFRQNASDRPHIAWE